MFCSKKKNTGVGGAVIRGYEAAIEYNADIVIKIDGDGQIDPLLIPKFIKKLLSSDFDYIKGTRFHNIDDIKKMPTIRIIGNLCLSFLNKLTSGYWNITDPTNGFIGIKNTALTKLPLNKISKDFFFESDLLFYLYINNSKIVQFPMSSNYGDEKSNLKIKNIIISFLFRHIKNFSKRIFYTYFLRDFNFGSICFLMSMIFLFISLLYGVKNVNYYQSSNVSTPIGVVVLTYTLVILGFQFLINFLNYDINRLKEIYNNEFKN